MVLLYLYTKPLGETMKYTILEIIAQLEQAPALKLSEEEQLHAGPEMQTEIETIKKALEELNYIAEREGIKR